MKKKWTLLLMAAVLLVGMMAGCQPSTGEEQTGEQYIDPVYPPHYEAVYQELFGADLDTVVEKLGYTRDDFTLVEDVIPYYRTEKTAVYLDQEFQVELHFFDGEAATKLSSVGLYKELPGTPQEQARLAFEIGQTLKKMFGHHPEKRDEKLEKAYVLDEALFEDWFTGTEDKNRQIDFRLTDAVDHIPDDAMDTYIQHNPEWRQELAAVQLEYWLFCYPSAKVPPTLRISYRTGHKHSTEFVRN